MSEQPAAALVVPSPDPAATRPAGYLGQWPPACNGCGHRHVPGVGCADHAWRDDCPYHAGADCPAVVEVTDTDGGPTLASPGVLFVAVCAACMGVAGLPPMAFSAQDSRDEWAMRHADELGHSVALAVQSEQTGTTVVGRADPDPDPDAEVPAESAPAPPPPLTVPDPGAAPLVAFRVPPGGPPDLMCRIPSHAAHACLLGRQGSSGIPEPHRAMFIGRVTAPFGEGTAWRVRIDGLIGAHRADLGPVIGFAMTVPAEATLPVVEDLVEGAIATSYGLPPHEFSVLLVTDAPYHDPPDPDAAEIIRRAQAVAAVSMFGREPHVLAVPDDAWPGCPVEGHTGCTPFECRPATHE